MRNTRRTSPRGSPASARRRRSASALAQAVRSSLSDWLWVFNQLMIVFYRCRLLLRVPVLFCKSLTALSRRGSPDEVRLLSSEGRPWLVSDTLLRASESSLHATQIAHTSPVPILEAVFGLNHLLSSLLTPQQPTSLPSAGSYSTSRA